MTITFKILCETLRLENEQQYDLLKTWCECHVSTDISYDGSAADQYISYLALAKQYLDYFLPNIPVNPNEVSAQFNGMTCVQYAALNGYDHYILNLTGVASHAFNQAASGGMTPLHLAAAGGFPHVIRALLKFGADATQTNQSNQLPIFSALFVPMFHDETLIGKKAWIFTTLNTKAPGLLEHQDSSGDTVFHLMAVHGFKRLLTEYMVIVPKALFISNNRMRYPIHTAILNNQPDIVELLLSVPDMAMLADAKGQGALHYAARYGSPAIVKQCCDATREINCIDNANRTPLMLAISSQNIEAAKILVTQGADVTMTDEQGFSILHLAIDTLDTDLIAWVVNHMAMHINQVDDHGHTALAHLIQYHADLANFESIERLLLDHGAVSKQIRV